MLAEQLLHRHAGLRLPEEPDDLLSSVKRFFTRPTSVSGSDSRPNRYSGTEERHKRQAKLLDLSRGSLYHQPEPVSAENLWIVCWIDELHLLGLFIDSRMLRDQLHAQDQISISMDHKGPRADNVFVT